MNSQNKMFLTFWLIKFIFFKVKGSLTYKIKRNTNNNKILESY
jgi:hypothetical protein